MKFIIPIFLLLSVTTCTLANTTGEPRHVLFTRTSDVPEGFLRGKATPKDTTVTFNVALKGANKNVDFEPRRSSFVCQIPLWPTVSCQLPVANCQLSCVNCQLAIVSCQLPIVNCQLPIASCQL